MKFTEQELLDNFIGIVNGKGQAIKYSPRVDEDICCYIPKNEHPGCAIGCQPGFREAFIHTHVDEEGINVSALSDYYKTELENVFGSFDSDEINFMHSLQMMHDECSHWNGNKIRKNIVVQFCKDHGLNVPESDYA